MSKVKDFFLKVLLIPLFIMLFFKYLFSYTEDDRIVDEQRETLDRQQRK